MRSPRTAMAVLLAVLLAACDKSALVPGPGASAKPRATATPKAGSKTPGPKGTATPDEATRPPAPGGPEALLAPARGTAVLSGRVALDAAYAIGPAAAEFISDQGGGVIANNGGSVLQAKGGLVSNNSGNLIANNGGGLLSHLGAGLTSKAKFISDQGGGLISNNGGGFISDQGGGLIANNGGGVIANNGGGLVSKTKYGLFQAADGPRSRPVAGMLIGVLSLRDNAYLPLGVDRENRPVYFVYSDAQGNFKVHIPERLADNVLVVASVPGTQDVKLAVDMVVKPVSASELVVDEGTTVLTTYMRRALVARMEAVLDPSACAPPISTAAGASTSSDAITLALLDYQGEFTSAGFEALSRAGKQRVLVRFTDAVIAQLKLDEVPILRSVAPSSTATGPAFPLLKTILAKMEDAAAARLKADPRYFEGKPYVALANLARGDRPPIAIHKAADVSELLVTEFLTSNDKEVMNRARAVFVDVGLEAATYDDMIACGGSLFAGIGAIVISTEAKDRLKATIKAAIEEERGLPAGPTSTCPPPLVPPSFDAAVTTLAGTGEEGSANGPGAAATFKRPSRLVYDPRGFLLVSEPDAHRVRQIDLNDPAHPVSTLAGSGKSGGEDGPAGKAAFTNPVGLALDGKGALYVAERGGHRIRKIAGYATADATVSTVAGDGTAGFADGPGATARFSQPEDLVFGPDGTLYVADTRNHRVRAIAADGTVRTLAGNGKDSTLDGIGDQASFDNPRGLAFMAGGLVVADAGGDRLRSLALSGGVATLAGVPSNGFADGTWYTAKLDTPYGLALGPNGALYVADSRNHRIRVFDPRGWAGTLAGQGPGGKDAGGFAEGTGAGAAFNTPEGVAVGPDGTVYVADARNNRIRMVKPPK